MPIIISNDIPAPYGRSYNVKIKKMPTKTRYKSHLVGILFLVFAKWSPVKSGDCSYLTSIKRSDPSNDLVISTHVATFKKGLADHPRLILVWQTATPL